MLFISFNGWKDIGPKGRPRILAHFTKAVTCNNPRGVYGSVALKEMLKNPPPAFEESDKLLILRALEQAPKPGI